MEGVMVRIGIVAAILLGWSPGLLCAAEDRQVVTESSLSETIVALDSVSPQERPHVLRDLFTAINRLDDVYARSRLIQALDAKLAELPTEEAPVQQEEIRGDPEALKSFAALAKQRRELLDHMPTPKELRKQIAALTYDPKQPEICLGKAMEIANIIDHIEDPDRQGDLREALTERLVDLQPKRSP